MCRRCVEKQQMIERMEREIATLLAGDLPEGVEYHPDTPDDPEIYESSRKYQRLHAIAGRVAVAMAILTPHDSSPAVELAEVAAELMAAQMEAEIAQQQVERAIRNSAPFN